MYPLGEAWGVEGVCATPPSAEAVRARRAQRRQPLEIKARALATKGIATQSGEASITSPLCVCVKVGKKKEKNYVTTYSCYKMSTMKKAKLERAIKKARPKKKKSSKKLSSWESRFVGKGSTQEHKYFDTALNFTIDSTGEVPSTGQLCLITQGDAGNQRDGINCHLESISIHAFLNYVPSTATSASTIAVILLVQDTQCNGAAATAGDVMNSTDFQSGHRNLTTGNRFKILKRFQFVLTATAGVSAAYNTVIAPWDYYSKLNIPMKFSNSTSSVADVESNNLFLLASSLQSDDLITVNGEVRLRFTDS